MRMSWAENEYRGSFKGNWGKNMIKLSKKLLKILIYNEKRVTEEFDTQNISMARG